MPDETMRAELAPCPFCGGTEIAVKVRKTTMVECKSCGTVVFDYHNGVQRNAIAAWNRRASAAPGGEPPTVKESLTPAPSDAGQRADPEALARRFHAAYERLAPTFGYETRADTRVFDPESQNGKLMIAVCAAISESEGSSNADR